jgi:zinc protease
LAPILPHAPHRPAPRRPRPLLAPGWAGAELYSRALANGLRVIVKEDRRSPTVAHPVWYRAGAMDETSGTTGVAHALERICAAVGQVRAVVAEFLANGPTEAELRDAKASLIGGFPLRLDSNRKLLNEWALIGFYRLPERWLADFPERVERVTLADLRAAFARHAAPERFATVVVGADPAR